jgi:beta-1,4-mannosyl-glycoprotein beta-1,4-N-acetylglucosaminyltransferase
VTRWAVSTINNELDVIEIRLTELAPVVDRFVFAEATVTQRGQAKPLYFEENKARYAKWLPKIEHVIVEDMPGGDGVEADWIRERFQRNAIERALYPLLEPGDTVLVSDLDEVPFPWELENLWDQPPKRILMDMFVYTLNWRWLDRACAIGSTASVHPAAAFWPGRNVHDILVGGWAGGDTGAVSGWHLAYQGNVEFLRLKMTSIADRFYEQLVPDEKKGDPNMFLTDAWIQGSIDTGRDIYGRDYRPSEWVGLDQMPPCVQADPAKYAHMMVPKPEGPPIGIRCTCGGWYDNQRVLQHFPKCELFDGEPVAA